MSYQFVDDSEEVKGILAKIQASDTEKAKEKEKVKGDKEGPEIEYVTFTNGKTETLRLVQLPSEKTIVEQRIHFFKKFDHAVFAKYNTDHVVVPSALKSMQCSGTDDCYGCRLEAYVLYLKYQHQFDSPENAEIWGLQKVLRASDKGVAIVIDREDGKLKVWSLTKSARDQVLAKIQNSKRTGHPAHPKKGFNLKVTTIDDSRSFTIVDADDSPLTADELKLLQDSPHMKISTLMERGTIESQRRMGIKFPGDVEPNGAGSAPTEAPPVANDSAPEVSSDALEFNAEDDIPF